MAKMTMKSFFDIFNITTVTVIIILIIIKILLIGMMILLVGLIKQCEHDKKKWKLVRQGILQILFF